MRELEDIGSENENGRNGRASAAIGLKSLSVEADADRVRIEEV
jgi:hypothetical protein